jgi:hypothetical protein
MELLLVVVPMVAVAGFVTIAVRRHRRRLALEWRQRERSAAPPRLTYIGARVVTCRTVLTTPLDAQGAVIVELRLEVPTADGDSVVTTRWAVDVVDVGRLRPDMVLSVGVDPSDPRDIYPVEPWAKRWT